MFLAGANGRICRQVLINKQDQMSSSAPLPSFQGPRPEHPAPQLFSLRDTTLPRPKLPSGSQGTAASCSHTPQDPHVQACLPTSTGLQGPHCTWPWEQPSLREVGTACLAGGPGCGLSSQETPLYSPAKGIVLQLQGPAGERLRSPWEVGHQVSHSCPCPPLPSATSRSTDSNSPPHTHTRTGPWT